MFKDNITGAKDYLIDHKNMAKDEIKKFFHKKIQSIKDANTFRKFRNDIQAAMTAEIKKDPKIGLKDLLGKLYDDGIFEHEITQDLTRHQVVNFAKLNPFKSYYNKIPKNLLQKTGELTKNAVMSIASLATLSVAAIALIFVDIPHAILDTNTNILLSENIFMASAKMFPEMFKEHTFSTNLLSEAEKIAKDFHKAGESVVDGDDEKERTISTKKPPIKAR